MLKITKTLSIVCMTALLLPAGVVSATTSQPPKTSAEIKYDNTDKIKVNPTVLRSKTTTTNKVPAFKPRIYRGKTMKENVLVVMMDFSNSKASTLLRNETSNYRKVYNKAYYNQLFFGDTFTGPDNKKYNSLKTYYQKVSGNSLTLQGQVSGWYRAKHPLNYYGHNEDAKVSELIMEAATHVAKDKNINMNRYDQYDYYDLDQDGKMNEPDGIIDKFVVVFSGIGESEGGGKFLQDSIWEHVSEVALSKTGNPKSIPGTYSKNSKFYKKRLGIAEYGILAEDSTVGTFAHEFGHMLGLIDEYDTAPNANNHAGEPVRYWSLMSYGADAGVIPGMEPVGLSPLAKSDLQQIYGGNWLQGSELDYKHISKKKRYYLLDQASIKGVNNDVVKINLPQILKKSKNGKIKRYNQYYLLEWRSHKGIDKGLSHIKDPFGMNHYGKGLLIWYVNEMYPDNANLSKHFGKSLVGVVDSSPSNITTPDGFVPMTDTQIFDAPFNTRSHGQYNPSKNYFFKKKSTKPVTLFTDKRYTVAARDKMLVPDSSRILPQLGIKIKVEGQNKDGTVGRISIYK
ncbi:immune inhibitor A domain-containing protein [Macrococcoides caseolyticum]|uniref:immune inhibitor A domain-containing protein n=1 Tax=Macrococcoides caseolyticum TaxID=69966 RepID=UPI001F40502E|nr:immune inhibitor A domain-containing protein [Macrococcus caseolyticus]MCE4955916.1 immune inhibitor A [Macrococcus caseolyticus]